MLYTAVAGGVAYDLGDFSSDYDAEQAALYQFGESLELVTPQLTTAVTVTAPLPTSSKAMLVLAAVALMLTFRGRI